jgi:hypothetical protein
MTQPSGRILSQPSRYRTYLRSSPIISFLDALAFIIRVLFTSCLLHISISRALKTTIRERYKDIVSEDASEGIQSLEKQIWLRWVFFMVGTLGPSIKLMAMQGVPWTKAWGAMFLFAFLVIEVAALFARKPTTPSAYSTLPGINGRATQSETERQVTQGFEVMEICTCCVGLMAHFTVLIWAFFDVWILRSSDYNPDGTTGALVSLISLLFISFVGNILIFCPPLTLLAIFLIYTANDLKHPTRSYGRKWSERACIGFLVICAFAVMGLFIYAIYKDHSLVADCFFFDLSLVCAPVFVFIVKKLCWLSPGLGETLLLASHEEISPTVDEGADDADAVDQGAVWSLTFCIANIILCLLWYWLRYNPANTLNPSWTGVFG